MNGSVTSEQKEVRVVLCGIGGYGQTYVKQIRENAENLGIRMVAAVDPVPERSEEYDYLKSVGVPIFASLGEFFQQGACDLVVVCSPMQFHCEQTCEALRNGAHVLCEKPLCSTEVEAETMAECERATGRRVLIGYQWSYSPGITQLKTDILSGRFGQPLQLKTLVCWPRSQAYYQRNRWAGRLYDAQGRAILDSPVNNATAHYLHNMLYVLGESAETSAWAEKVEGLLLRANPIENYDTAALKFTTTQGVGVWFFTTHATEDFIDPTFVYEFEKGTVTYKEGAFQGVLADGEVIQYDSPEGDPLTKLSDAVAVARGEGGVRCGIAASRAHTHCVLLAQEALTPIIDFPADSVLRREADGVEWVYVQGLLETMQKCFQEPDWTPLADAYQVGAVRG